MRRLLAVCLLLAASAAAAETPRKLWSGAGKTALASEPANWVEQSSPTAGDRVVFSNVSSKDCAWDIDVLVSSFTMTQSYAGTVRLSKVRLRAERNVRVSGGVLDLGEGSLTVYWRIYIEKTGRLEIGHGELRLAPAGILVDEGGTLASTGKSQARVTAARSGESFSVVVGSGNVMIDNPSGTVVEQSKGIVMYSGANIRKAEGVEMKSLAPGASAVTVFSKSTETIKLQNWTFDESVKRKVEVPAGMQESMKVELETPKAAPAQKRWTGRGASPLASEAANWDGGRPGTGDTAVFDSTGTKDCDWDYPAALAALRVDEGFAHAVRLGTSTVNLDGDLSLAGGTLDLGGADLRVGGTLAVSSGTLDLGEATVRIGKALAQTGGRIESAGEGSPVLTALAPGGFFSVSLASGSVRFAATGGTRFDATTGLDVGPSLSLEAFDSLYITHQSPGTPALKLERSTPAALRFQGWQFDESVAVNVDASGLPEGGSLLMADASGAGAGSARSHDPARQMVWQPDQAGTVGGEPLAELMRDKTSVTPVFDVELLGGQYFFQHQDGALSGNFHFTAAAAVKTPRYSKWTFEPLLSSGYRGTKQVTDLVGGGTLFQETIENRAALRAVYEASPLWKVKPSASYEIDYLKETKDETWGHGLFDHRRPRAGVEAEYLYRDPFSLRFGYDFYRLQFPNYVSLESQTQGLQAGSLARELAGRHVIDSDNHAFNAAIDVETPWRSFAQAEAGVTLRRFGDQHIVAGSGDLTPAVRSDTVLSAAVSWRVPRQLNATWKTAPALGIAYTRNDSNQNSYDAERVTFLPRYYDSRAWRLSADAPLSHLIGADRWLELTAVGAWERTDYPGRLVQDAAGTYGASAIHTDAVTAALRVSWPLVPHFRWTASLETGRQSSNMHFEKLYQYNYSTFAYLMGFSWEY